MDFSLELGAEVLRRTPDALRAMLSGLSEGWIAGDEGPDTWSPWQVVGHLIHIDECDWIDRTRVILDHGTDKVFEPVDREAGFTRFRDWKLGDLLDRFASVRTSNAEGEREAPWTAGKPGQQRGPVQADDEGPDPPSPTGGTAALGASLAQPSAQVGHSPARSNRRGPSPESLEPFALQRS